MMKVNYKIANDLTVINASSHWERWDDVICSKSSTIIQKKYSLKLYIFIA